MEKAKNDIQFVIEIYSRMLDFANYYLDLHSSSSCKKKIWQYLQFAKQLKNYLLCFEKV